MLSIPDTLAGEPIDFHYAETRSDLREVAAFVKASPRLGIDTESTGLNCYQPGWQLRSVQVGDRTTAYVVPARYKRFIGWLAERDIQWIGHNGPHDWRSIDAHLGYDSGGYCIGETYLPAHHSDSRNQKEGGVGHELKDLATAHVDRNAGKWEKALKAAFKEILIPIQGEIYTSGPKKGTQKYRKAKLAEGWGLIPANDPRYIAYSAADTILTIWVWDRFLPVQRENARLYARDWRIQQAADRLVRRGIPVDKRYTQRLSDAYLKRTQQFQAEAAEYGCRNVNSPIQIADTLLELGVQLKARTEKGQFKTDNKILRAVRAESDDPRVRAFLGAVLGAKQLDKRRENYTEAFLKQMDADGRIHASINTLGARTGRMSVSNPPLQQLPTADREDDE